MNDVAVVIVGFAIREKKLKTGIKTGIGTTPTPPKYLTYLRHIYICSSYVPSAISIALYLYNTPKGEQN